jgi:Brp/Blh family beta-carotene 15,15'-monooxygenase
MNSGTRLVIILFILMTLFSYALPNVAEWIALMLMICAGIPHGSYDLRVAKAKWSSREISPAKIVAIYLVCVFLMSALCVFTPGIGLTLFLAISAIHFSEGEFQSSAPASLVSGVLFGIGAILLPIGLHSDTSMQYLGYFVDPSTYELLAPKVRVLSLIVLVISSFIVARECLRRLAPTETIIERCLCLFGWVLLPPLAGFCVWFIGRHSRQHLELCKTLFHSSQLKIPLDFAFISLLAIVGLLPFARIFDFSDINQLFAASICLIAGLTLPHMIVSYNMRACEQIKQHGNSQDILPQ